MRQCNKLLSSRCGRGGSSQGRSRPNVLCRTYRWMSWAHDAKLNIMHVCTRYLANNEWCMLVSRHQHDVQLSLYRSASRVAETWPETSYRSLCCTENPVQKS